MSINNIADYIKEVSKIISKHDTTATTIVYRGESQIFETACQPNIFRKEVLKKNKFFEKNLFDEMTANKITAGTSYLEKAIDAQHGGFPSRLLDVTYNSLVALYFASTPHFHYPEDSEDKKCGVVYIYFFDKLFCPSGDNINSTYNSIINREKQHKWLTKYSIFQKNHKLIDHIKLNNRIIAQQGALILFHGDDVSPISAAKYDKIIIPYQSKNTIRNELKTLFGLHTGFIYPEPSNLVKEISDKSNKIDNKPFAIETELELIKYNLSLDLDYYENLIIQGAFNKNITDKSIISTLQKVEELLFSYKLGIEELATSNLINDNELFALKESYSNIVKEFLNNVTTYLSKRNIDISQEEFSLHIS